MQVCHTGRYASKRPSLMTRLISLKRTPDVFPHLLLLLTQKTLSLLPFVFALSEEWAGEKSNFASSLDVNADAWGCYPTILATDHSGLGKKNDWYLVFDFGFTISKSVAQLSDHSLATPTCSPAPPPPPPPPPPPNLSLWMLTRKDKQTFPLRRSLRERFICNCVSVLIVMKMIVTDNNSNSRSSII